MFKLFFRLHFPQLWNLKFKLNFLLFHYSFLHSWCFLSSILKNNTSLGDLVRENVFYYLFKTKQEFLMSKEIDRQEEQTVLNTIILF